MELNIVNLEAKNITEQLGVSTERALKLHSQLKQIEQEVDSNKIRHKVQLWQRVLAICDTLEEAVIMLVFVTEYFTSKYGKSYNRITVE